MKQNQQIKKGEIFLEGGEKIINKNSGQGTIQYVIVGLVIVSIAISGYALYLVSGVNVPNNVTTEQDLQKVATTSELNRVRDEFKNSLQDLKGKIEAQKELRETRSKLTSLRDNYEKIQERFDSVKSKYRSLKSEHENLRNEYQGVENQLSSFQKIIETPEILSALPAVDEFKRSALWSSGWLSLTSEATERLDLGVRPDLLEAYGFESAVRKDYQKEAEEGARLEITIVSFSDNKGAEEIYTKMKEETMREMAKRKKEAQYEENVTVRLENYSPDLADESFGMYFSRTREYEWGEYTYSRDSIVFRENSTLVTARIRNSQIEKKDILAYARLVEGKLS